MHPATQMKTKAKIKLFEFHQNNSGGHFWLTEDIGHKTFIEAKSPKEADKIAESKGIYFHGLGDCECCGPRFSSSTNWGGKPFEGDPFEFDKWDRSGSVHIVHYKDGTRKSQTKE